MLSLDDTSSESYSGLNYAYFCPSLLSLDRVSQLQKFIFNYFDVAFLNIEKVGGMGDDDDDDDWYDLYCLIYVPLDENSDIPEWVAAGIANNANQYLSDQLYLIDKEKLCAKRAEIEHADKSEFVPIDKWLIKYLFFDNYKGDLDICSRHYSLDSNRGFVCEKRGKYHVIIDKRSDEEKSASKYYIGLGHYFDNRFIEAASCFADSAEMGESRAQDYLGRMYIDGLGVQQNPRKGLFWLKKAALQNNSAACYTLGKIYQSGTLVQKDNSKAIAYFRKGDERYDAASQVELGHHYRNGLGVKTDLAMAFDYYQKAALAYGNDDGEAYFRVANAYDLGLGVKQDAEEAFFAYAKAADLGHARAQFKIAGKYRDGSNVVNKNSEEALHWFALSAEQGFEEAAIERDKLLELIK